MTELEKAAEKYVEDSTHELYELRKQCFIDGAEWQQEQAKERIVIKPLNNKNNEVRF